MAKSVIPQANIFQTVGPVDPSFSDRLEQRRQAALAVVAHCVELLQTHFGAQRVIVFGSLTGDGPWHWNSDLDLAVEGLSEAAWWEAIGALEKLAPAWLAIDLVRLETVHPGVRARILQEKPIAMDKYLALKGRLEDELATLERTSQGLETALSQYEKVPQDFATRTLASYVADFYEGCERLSERVAVTLDGGIPQAEDWHQALLRQMADPGGEGRPPLWQGSLLLVLDEYRKFRHVMRHRYGIELKADRVLALAAAIPATLERVRDAANAFGNWLAQQSD